MSEQLLCSASWGGRRKLPVRNCRAYTWRYLVKRVHGQAADLGREGGVLFSHGVVGEVRERRVVEDWKDGGSWSCLVELGCLP